MSCKGCHSSVYVSNEKIEQQIAEQLMLETDIVDDSTYEARITNCYSCPSFVYDSTCQHCGCFVKFRAKLAYKDCPFPNGSRWSEAQL